MASLPRRDFRSPDPPIISKSTQRRSKKIKKIIATTDNNNFSNQSQNPPAVVVPRLWDKTCGSYISQSFSKKKLFSQPKRKLLLPISEHDKSRYQLEFEARKKKKESPDQALLIPKELSPISQIFGAARTQMPQTPLFYRREKFSEDNHVKLTPKIARRRFLNSFRQSIADAQNRDRSEHKIDQSDGNRSGHKIDQSGGNRSKVKIDRSSKLRSKAEIDRSSGRRSKAKIDQFDGNRSKIKIDKFGGNRSKPSQIKIDQSSGNRSDISIDPIRYLSESISIDWLGSRSQNGSVGLSNSSESQIRYLSESISIDQSSTNLSRCRNPTGRIRSSNSKAQANSRRSWSP